MGDVGRRGSSAVFWQLFPSVLILLCFLILPLLVVGRITLYETDQAYARAYGWSIRQYAKFFASSFYLHVLGDTVIDALIVSMLTLIAGFPVGYSLARMTPQARRWRIALVILPFTLSLAVNVFGWLVILGGTGLVNRVLLGAGIVHSPLRLLFNRGAVLIVLAHSFLPFQILSIMSIVAQIDPALEDAAANLRAGPWTTLRRVVLPLAWPGVVSGSTLVFILSVSAFVTPRLIGGGRVQMIGSLIFEQVIVVLNWPFGAAMALVLLIIVLGLIAAVNRSLGSRSHKTPS